jgi:hypothetical protein
MSLRRPLPTNDGRVDVSEGAVVPEAAVIRLSFGHLEPPAPVVTAEAGQQLQKWWMKALGKSGSRSRFDLKLNSLPNL